MKSARMRVALLVCTALVVGACSNPFGRDDDEASATVSLNIQHDLASPVSLRARIGGRDVALPPVMATTGASSRTVHVDVGTHPVTVALLDAAGDTLAAVAFAQAFHRGSDHWVAARVGQRRLTGYCSAPALAAALPSGGDSLFVEYGGIPRGAVC